MDLISAFRLHQFPCLALVGAGGKTSALFNLARQLEPPVIVTATTHMAFQHSGLADVHMQIWNEDQLSFIKSHLQPKIYLLTGTADENRKWVGINESTAEVLFHAREKAPYSLLIEADGSRHLPIKAPGDNEPPIPPFVDTVICVAGLSALGKPLSEEWVFRSQRFAKLSGGAEQSPITTNMLARVLCHPEGGLKNIPPASKKICLLTQIMENENLNLANDLARQLLSGYDSVILTSFSEHKPDLDSGPVLPKEMKVITRYEKTAGIILAAGGSTRYGQPKPLLEWQGETFIHKIARTALLAGLSPIIIVTGAFDQEINTATDDLPVQIIHNPQWENGQSTSIKAGIGALPDYIGAAVFMLSDQPLIPPSLIEGLIAHHRTTGSPIIFPQVANRRSNPVLFDQITFSSLQSIQGDIGGRAIFNLFPLDFIQWDDMSILVDIDTPDDYLKLKSKTSGYNYEI